MSADSYENADDADNNEQSHERVKDEGISRACCQITKMAVPMTLPFTLSIEIFLSSQKRTQKIFRWCLGI